MRTVNPLLPQINLSPMMAPRPQMRPQGQAAPPMANPFKGMPAGQRDPLMELLGAKIPGMGMMPPNQMSEFMRMQMQGLFDPLMSANVGQNWDNALGLSQIGAANALGLGW